MFAAFASDAARRQDLRTNSFVLEAEFSPRRTWLRPNSHDRRVLLSEVLLPGSRVRRPLFERGHGRTSVSVGPRLSEEEEGLPFLSQARVGSGSIHRMRPRIEPYNIVSILRETIDVLRNYVLIRADCLILFLL